MIRAPLWVWHASMHTLGDFFAGQLQDRNGHKGRRTVVDIVEGLHEILRAVREERLALSAHSPVLGRVQHIILIRRRHGIRQSRVRCEHIRDRAYIHDNGGEMTNAE